MKNISFIPYLCLAGFLICISCNPASNKTEPTNEPQPAEIKAEKDLPLPQIEPVKSAKIDQSTEERKPEVVGKAVGTEEEVSPKSTAPSKPKKVKKKPKKLAKITFDSVVHRLPDVIEGDNFKHEFVFENTGEVPLSIKEAKASCGCTTPTFMFLDIAPGEKSKISIDYFSVNKFGPQEAEVEIKANTWPSTTKLTMLFNVLPRENEEKKAEKDSLPD